MRKLLLFMMASLDGYYEGTKPWSLEWHNVDEEFNEFAVEQLKGAGVLLFGRKTYEGMAAYWSSPAAKEKDPVVAGLMNRIPKLVFSKTLKKAEWGNTRLIHEEAAEEIKRLKLESGGYLLLAGSSDLAVSLSEIGLIDEYRFMVNPVLLGQGKPQFQGLKEKVKLKLDKTKVFNNNNVLLCYQSAK